MGAKTGQMSHVLLTITAGFAISAPKTSGHLDALGKVCISQPRSPLVR